MCQAAAIGPFGVLAPALSWRIAVMVKSKLAELHPFPHVENVALAMAGDTSGHRGPRDEAGEPP